MPRDTNTAIDTFAELVDRIGNLQAQLAPLTAKLKQAQDELKAHGAGKYTGTRFDCTVSEFQRANLDMDAVRAKLSAQFLQAHTSYTDVVQVRCTARKLAV